LCAVSAINVLIDGKRFGPFLAFLRCSAWVILISLPAWPAARVSEIYAFGPAGLAGAALFGAGAAINGGCNFGTLTRFATGDTSFAMTVVGGTLGVWIEEKTFITPTASSIGPTSLAHPEAAAIALPAVVGLWRALGLAGRKNAPNIRSKANRRWRAGFSDVLERHRNRVEGFFNTIKHCRRVATRYESSLPTSSPWSSWLHSPMAQA
jgi:hypothetical protein